MNRTATSILLAAAISTTAAQAHVLTPRQAYDAVMRTASTGGASRAASALNAVPLLTLRSGDDATVYLFAGVQGYVVASAESETPPLLGYTATVAPEGGQLPDGLLYWLDYYNHEIAQLRSGNVLQLMHKTSADYAPIDPITTTFWNQGPPYNNLCPEDAGGRCVTGCVATGMAQAMKAHEWPPQGRGSITYRWQNGGVDLSCDFSESVYDWKKILDYGGTTEAEHTAVATLMRDCGYSVGMNYSSYASGASDVYIAPALYTFFNYDKTLRFAQRTNFHGDEWEQMVYDEIASGSPVIYCGSGAVGGHCFLADGYSSDGYFHFNWGWGGVSNGYFRLSALAPGVQGIGGNDDNFNSNQSIVVGMHKPVEGSELSISLVADGDFTPRHDSYTSGSVRFGSVTIINYSVEPVTGRLGVKLTPAEGEPVYAADTRDITLSNFYGDSYYTSGFRVPFEDFPTVGSYTVTPAFLSDGRWIDIESNKAQPVALKVEATDGVLTFEQVEASVNVSITDFKLTSPLYAGQTFSVSFDALNEGEKDFYDDFVLVLAHDDTALTTSPIFNMTLDSGEQTHRDITTVFYDAVTPGDYDLYIIDRMNYIYAGPLSVTVEEDPSGINATEVSESLKCRMEGSALTLEGASESAVITIYYADGRVAMTSSGSHADLSQLDKGAYIISARDGNAAATLRIVR